MNAGLIGATAASIAVPIAFALFAKAFPAKPLPKSTLSLEELRRKYLKWDIGLRLIFIAVTAGFSLAIWVLLRGLAALYAQLLPPAEIIFTPTPVYWAIPAMFLGILCSGVGMDPLCRALMRGRYSYAEYLAYQTLVYKFDADKVARLLAAFVGIGCAVLVLLGLDCYVLLNGETFVVNGYLSLGETHYNVHSITQIRSAPQLIAPNGNVVFRREFAVRFANGDGWSTNSIPASTSLAAKRHLVELLSERAGIPIQEVDTFQRGDL